MVEITYESSYYAAYLNGTLIECSQSLRELLILLTERHIEQMTDELSEI